MQTPDEKDTVSPAQTSPCDWHSIGWKQAKEYVRTLRQAIFRATREGDLKKVRSLQRLMLRSYENRVVSVRRVTQTNAGKHTPGVDRVVVKTPEARGRLVDLLANYEPWKPLPARRVYIPKANGKQRPLGIPVVIDRAIQAIEKNALEPFWEARFEDSSYGFRPGRKAHDALQRIHLLGSSRATRHWVLDADIKGCFDNINHDKLMEVIGQFPGRELIRQWLKAGYREEGVFHETETGTPQGGVISPLLANIDLHGMEEALGVRYWGNGPDNSKTFSRDSVAPVRYADDFVVFCHTRKEAEEAKKKLETFLAERGLAFSEEKTRIVHLTEGFDFLGFTIRLFPSKRSKYGYRLIMRPSRKSVKAYMRKLKELFRQANGHSADYLCKLVNPAIYGWTNYFRVGASSRTFAKLDDYLFYRQRKWVNRQHRRKSAAWKKKRYWGSVVEHRKDNWTFKGQKSFMWKHSWTPIKRHVLVQRFACWDDPVLDNYWQERKVRETDLALTPFQQKIAKRQKYVCPVCRDWILNGEDWHEHHVIPREKGGPRSLENIQLLHLFCHQKEHLEKKEVKET